MALKFAYSQTLDETAKNVKKLNNHLKTLRHALDYTSSTTLLVSTSSARTCDPGYILLTMHMYIRTCSIVCSTKPKLTQLRVSNSATSILKIMINSQGTLVPS